MMINIVQSLVTARNLINLSRCSKRYAGHSKWANIKHDKAVKDAKRAANFNRLRRLMSVAIAEGNSANPASNLKLAQVIERARKAMMPMSSINNLLTTAQASKVNTRSGLFEIRGPSGTIIIVEYACENFTALKMTINSALKKAGWSISDSGAHHLFSRRGVVTTEVQGDLETATDHAIQVDAEDVQEYVHDETKEFHFFCEPRSVYEVKKRLADLNYDVKSAEVLYIPHSRVDLNDKDLETAITLCDRLEALDDVVKLYDNIA